MNKTSGISQNKYAVTSDDGKIVDPSAAIFPIFMTEPNGGHLEEVEFVGTGFFIHTSGVFITAAHVLRSAVDTQQEKVVKAMGIMHNYEMGKYMPRSIKKAFWTGTDVVIGYLDQPKHKVTGTPLLNKILTVSDDGPVIGDELFTAACPRSKVSPDKCAIEMRYDYYDGRVIDVFPNGRDSTMLPGPCVQTNIHLHGGSSGGPVFNKNGKVIGINSSSFFGSVDVSFVSLIWPIIEAMLDGIIDDTGRENVMTLRELIEHQRVG